MMQYSFEQRFLDDREKFLIEAQEEAARDKLMVDAIVNKIEEEDRR